MKSSCILNCLLGIGIILLAACEKTTVEDFRAPYVGKYQVSERLERYGSCGPPFYSLKDTVISVHYGNTDSTLLVLGREVYLDSDGHYSAYHYGLRMRNDSISSHHMNGGLGCGIYETYTGIKISDTP